MIESIHKKYVVCDVCCDRRQVECVAAPRLPKGWRSASDFYGNEINCCQSAICQKKFPALAEICGIELEAGK